MEQYQTEILKIRELLAAHKEGMSITEIAGMLDMNRNTVAKYMDILHIQGAVDGRRKGTSKVFFLSERLPVLSLRKICTRPFFVVDRDGTVMDANPDLCNLVRMNADQIIRHPAGDLPIQFLEGGRPGIMEKAVLNGTEQRIRAQIRQGETVLTTSLVLIPVVFETGKPGITVMVDTDTAVPDPDRKNSPSSEVMALLNDGFEYIIRRTGEGITQYVNEPYCHAAGKSREELIGRLFKPLVSPEDVDRIRAHLAGLSPRYPVGTIEYRVVMANGELRYQRWQDRAVFNSRGELDTINSFGIDITEQVLAGQKLRKAQETLEESIVQRTEELRGINRQLYSEIAQRERMEEQLLLAQFAMDKAEDMVFWINQDARIRYANDMAAAGLRYERTDLLDHPIGDIVPFFTLAEWDLLWEDLKHGGEVSRETFLLKKDGTQFPADIRFTRLEYRGREFVYCTSRDLSERMRMDRALKEANRKLNVYTSIARHDIQNKITVLLAYLGRTKKAVTDPRLLDYLGHQEQAAKAIRNEINLTRDFKDMGLHPPEWHNLPSVVAEMAHRHEHDGIRIESHLPVVEIFTDGHLDLVFDRLINKLLARSGSDPTIRLSHRVKDGAFIILAEAPGEGYSVEEKARLFELQSDGSGDRELFIAREILSLTAISLSETGEPGRSTRFEIQVPVSYYRFVPETP